MQVPRVGVDQSHLVSNRSHNSLVGVTQYGNVVAAVEVFGAVFVVNELFAAA